MPNLQERLEGMRPRIILDVATGAGGGAAWLSSVFGEGVPIVCSDITARGFNADSFDRGRMIPLVSDVLGLAIGSGSVDLLSVVNSLHHFPDPAAAIREMGRVSASGGAVLVAEMHREVSSEAQRSHMLLHHWWAASDTLMGVSHGETFRRSELVELVESLSPSELLVEEQSSFPGDPHDPRVLERLRKACDSYIERLSSHGGADGLIAEGRRLRRRLDEHGFSPAPRVVLLAIM